MVRQELTPQITLEDVMQESTISTAYIGDRPRIPVTRLHDKTLEQKSDFFPVHIAATLAKCLSKIIVLYHVIVCAEDVDDSLLFAVVVSVTDSLERLVVFVFVIFSDFSEVILICVIGRGAHQDILLYR